jgi:hypothetical protein
MGSGVLLPQNTTPGARQLPSPVRGPSVQQAWMSALITLAVLCNFTTELLATTITDP